MAQFASTLYPQTNATNQALLDLRSSMAYARNKRERMTIIHEHIRYLTFAFDIHAEAHRRHALRVLRRLAALSG